MMEKGSPMQLGEKREVDDLATDRASSGKE